MPPYLRLVPASACWNASKISFSLLEGMPMPLSETLEGDHRGCRTEQRMIAAPAADGASDLELYAAFAP